MYFGNRRPRGFRYVPRFSDERRDILESLRRGVSPDVLAEKSLSEDKSCKRPSAIGGRVGCVGSLAAALALAVLLAAAAILALA